MPCARDEPLGCHVGTRKGTTHGHGREDEPATVRIRGRAWKPSCSHFGRVSASDPSHDTTRTCTDLPATFQGRSSRASRPKTRRALVACAPRHLVMDVSKGGHTSFSKTCVPPFWIPLLLRCRRNRPGFVSGSKGNSPPIERERLPFHFVRNRTTLGVIAKGAPFEASRNLPPQISISNRYFVERYRSMSELRLLRSLRSFSKGTWFPIDWRTILQSIGKPCPFRRGFERWERTVRGVDAMPATHIFASDELSPMFGTSQATKKDVDGSMEDPEAAERNVTNGTRWESSGWAKHGKLVWCVSGVFLSLTTYGLLQERIMTLPYGKQHDMFTSSLFVVLCNRAFSAATALVALWSKGEGLTASAPLKHYASISVSNVVSTYCQYEALKYVSFPLQTIFKSAKMAPVMVWSTLLLHRHYTLKEYASAGTVTLGCAVFLLTGNVKSVIKEVHATDGGMFYGLGLLVLFLVADGYTSTYQERLFKRYRMSIHNQILHITTFSSAISLIVLAVTDQLTGTAKFVVQHPSCMLGIIMISITATIGQMFISYTIQSFGSLLFATVMTTRQCFSLFLSCIFFSHPLSGWQWAGAICVFSALYFQSFTRNAGKQ